MCGGFIQERDSQSQLLTNRTTISKGAGEIGPEIRLLLDCNLWVAVGNKQSNLRAGGWMQY